MTILVTGGAGYIGSHVVRALVDEGHKVVVVDNLKTGNCSALSKEVTFIKADVCDRKTMRAVLKEHSPDAVMHLAALIDVEESVRIPHEYDRVNRKGTLVMVEELVDAMGDKPVDFIFSSTAAVYGNPTTSPVTVDDTPKPINPYGASKLAAEKIVEEAQKKKPFLFRHAILRYFNVAGADPKGRIGYDTKKKATHLIRAALEAAQGKREVLDIFGTDYPTPDGTCVRDYVHVSDVSSAHVAAFNQMRNSGRSGIYNCGYGKGYSVREVIEAVERVTGKKLPTRPMPRRPGDPAILVAKQYMPTTWKPEWGNGNLVDMIRHQWAWTQRHSS